MEYARGVICLCADEGYCGGYPAPMNRQGSALPNWHEHQSGTRVAEFTQGIMCPCADEGSLRRQAAPLNRQRSAPPNAMSH